MASYFNALRVFNAEQFKNSISDSNTALYLTFGKSDPWLDDSQPDNTTANTRSELDVWYNMIGAKRVVSSDFRHVVPRIDWTANTVYTQFDDSFDLTNLDANLSNFYAMTSDYFVYKCLDNGANAVSTVMPTSTNTAGVVKTSDGYTWKFMYELSHEEKLRFLTADWLPVKTLSAYDGSLQWDVQENATRGGLHAIVVENPGENYTNANSVIVSVFGDGYGAAAEATVNTITNTISSIDVTDYGYGYSRAIVRVTGGNGANCSARAVITPIGGHGSNPIYELGASNLLIDVRMFGTEQNKYPGTTDYRQVALLKDPWEYGTTNVSSNTVISQTFDMTLYNYAVGVGAATDYSIGELVYQGTSYTDSTFSARVVNWNSANAILKVTQYGGYVTLAQTIYGLTTTTSKVVGAAQTPDLQPYTGQILYVDNFTPITKDPDQIDDLKLVIKF